MAAKKKSKAKPAKAKPAPKAKSKPPAKKSKAKAKPAAKAKAKPAPKAKAKPAAKARPTPQATPTAKSAASSVVKAVKKAGAKVVRAAKAALNMMDPDTGKPAPSFDLTDEKGAAISSSSLSGKPYLLYFYPKDDTPGCTKEACDIRDNFARFGQQGLRVLGVSPDSSKSHAKFGAKYGLPFTLVSDPEKSLANAYGVWAMKQNYGKEYMGIVRSTFLIGADGLIKKSYRGVKVDGHVAAILEDAKELL